MNKNSKVDDNILGIIIGGSFMGISKFNDGMLWERILFLLGLFIFLVGIVRTIMKYKDQNKKGMIIFLTILGVLLSIAFLGLLCRLIFA